MDPVQKEVSSGALMVSLVTLTDAAYHRAILSRRPRAHIAGLVSSVGVVIMSGLYQLSRTVCISTATSSGDLTVLTTSPNAVKFCAVVDGSWRSRN